MVIIKGAHAGFAINVQFDESILISGAGVLNTISGTGWIVFDAPNGQSKFSISVSDLIKGNPSTALVGAASADSLTGTASHD